MQRRIRLVVAAFTAALLVAACTSGDAAEDDDLGIRPIDEPPADDSSDDTSPDPDDESDTEPEPEPEPDPFAIPDDIDEAYVDLVMNELFAVHTTTLHDALARAPNGELEEKNAERIRAVFSGPQLIHIGENFVRYATDADSRDGFLPVAELGDLRWETQQVVESDDGCIVAIGFYDLREVAAAPFDEDEFSLVSLTPARERNDPAEAHNPTPWRIHDLTLLIGENDEAIPREDWDDLSYEEALETTCEGGKDG